MQKIIDFIKVYAFQHLYEFWKLGHKGSLGKQIIDKERWQEETNSNKGSKRFLSCSSSSSSNCTWFWKLLRVSKSSAASFQSKTCIFSLIRWGLEDLGIALTPRCIAHLMSTWPGVFLIFSAICMPTKSHNQSITFVKSLVLRCSLKEPFTLHMKLRLLYQSTNRKCDEDIFSDLSNSWVMQLIRRLWPQRWICLQLHKFTKHLQDSQSYHSKPRKFSSWKY